MKRKKVFWSLCLAVFLAALPPAGTAGSAADIVCVQIDRCIAGNEYLLVLLAADADPGMFADGDVLFMDQLKADGNTVSAVVFGVDAGSCRAIAGGVFSGGVSSPRTVEIIRLPETGPGLQEIGEEAFANTSFTHLYLNDGVTAIGARAFADCPSLCFVFIPTSVTEIASDAFAGSNRVVIGCEADSEAYRFASGNGIRCRVRK